VFLRFYGVFVFLANIDIHDIRNHYNLLTYFWVLASGSPTVASGPPFSCGNGLVVLRSCSP